MQAFKRTQCFQEWYDVRPDTEFFDALPTGHPFAGTLSVADMKLKIAQYVKKYIYILTVPPHLKFFAFPF